jgi:adenylate cyclase
LELSPGDPMMLYNCACLYSQLGEVDRAVTGCGRRSPTATYENFGWMKHDPDLNAVRDHPEFIAMLDGR